MQEAATVRTGKMSFGVSLMVHAAILLVFMAVSSRTGLVPQEMLTVVLDGQFAMGSGGGGPGQVSEEKIKKPEPSRKTTAKRPARADSAVRDIRAEKPMENAGPVSNSFSEVVSDDMRAGNGVAAAGTGDGSPAGAAGAGGGGSGAGGGSGGGQGSGKAAYLKRHFAFIRDLILKNLNYPSVARKMGWSGHLTVSFVICEGGKVENIRVIKSSGHKVLDENAVTTIKEIQPFPKPPVKAEIVIPIEYRLERQMSRTRG
jgi:protein TonB